MRQGARLIQLRMCSGVCMGFRIWCCLEVDLVGEAGGEKGEADPSHKGEERRGEEDLVQSRLCRHLIFGESLKLSVLELT